jgi:hypothetical protein
MKNFSVVGKGDVARCINGASNIIALDIPRALAESYAGAAV